MNPLCFCPPPLNHRGMRLAMCFLFALFLPKNETPDPDPKRFAEAIAKFTEADQANPPAKGGIVFTGSSSIRRWDLAKSFPKLKPLNRGFGGSHFSDSNHYLEETVLRYEPSVLVVFNGSNDLWREKPPAQVLKDFLEFKNRIFKRVPQCKIVLIPVKPSPKRLEIIETERALNKLLAAEAAKDDRLVLIEGMFDTLLNADGQPDETLFLKRPTPSQRIRLRPLDQTPTTAIGEINLLHHHHAFHNGPVAGEGADVGVRAGGFRGHESESFAGNGGNHFGVE